MKKYICFGGYIPSKNDNDIHYIGAGRLVELYGVNPRDCILVNNNDKTRLLGLNLDDYIQLHPMYDGVYVP